MLDRTLLSNVFSSFFFFFLPNCTIAHSQAIEFVTCGVGKERNGKERKRKERKGRMLCVMFLGWKWKRTCVSYAFFSPALFFFFF